MTLTQAKSQMVQSITCELDMLQKGNIACANQMMNLRYAAELRTYIIECLDDDYEANREVINYLFEQVKELVLMITQNNC